MGKINMGGFNVSLTIDGMDEALEKANRYLKIMKEANEIAEELANFDLSMVLTSQDKADS